MKHLLSTWPLAALMLSFPCCADEGIHPWGDSPWYWACQDKPVLLVGGSDDDNLFQWPEKELIEQLDRLAAAGGNLIRNTMSDRKDKGFEVYPFKQGKDGKYDLGKWNREYWDRFERMLRETEKRGVIVQIEVWDRFDYTDTGGADRWQIHPYNPKNNVNYSYEESGFAERYPDHPGANRQPFFFTTPNQRNNTAVLKYQQRFVEKMLEHTLRRGNVLYCMDNETSGEEEWGRYWAEFIKARAAKKGRTVFVTEMWDNWKLTDDVHRRTFDHPERYDFVDVSQNNHISGEKHWDNFLFAREYLSGHPRPMNTIKTYGADGNKFGHTDQDGIERFWHHVLAGAAAARFHRPDSGLGLNDKAVACLRAVRKLESKIPLWSVHAANGLLSDREQNAAYLAADPGKAYALYFPAGGKVTLDLSTAAGQMSAHWIDIATGEWGPVQPLEGGAKREITAPGPGNWAAAVIPRE
ncbi:MAG: hypothetical protein GXY15_07355 [Candidatus Hydrogenedentes bacterium]|nr:hypothetical protein [Candidatus Hydrogenedentota bacterium]